MVIQEFPAGAKGRDRVLRDEHFKVPIRRESLATQTAVYIILVSEQAGDLYPRKQHYPFSLAE